MKRGKILDLLMPVLSDLLSRHDEPAEDDAIDAMRECLMAAVVCAVRAGCKQGEQFADAAQSIFANTTVAVIAFGAAKAHDKAHDKADKPAQPDTPAQTDTLSKEDFERMMGFDKP